jgi:hypothetical protein
MGLVACTWFLKRNLVASDAPRERGCMYTDADVRIRLQSSVQLRDERTLSHPKASHDLLENKPYELRVTPGQSGEYPF